LSGWRFASHERCGQHDTAPVVPTLSDNEVAGRYLARTTFDHYSVVTHALFRRAQRSICAQRAGYHHRGATLVAGDPRRRGGLGDRRCPRDVSLCATRHDQRDRHRNSRQPPTSIPPPALTARLREHMSIFQVDHSTFRCDRCNCRTRKIGLLPRPDDTVRGASGFPTEHEWSAAWKIESVEISFE
jgi:hypothetical protein